ncbi:3-deoxy-7-phosphoheptulonate synthase [Pseudomonas tolaasii]
MDRLNPRNEPGRLTLLHRMGTDQLRETLPALLNAVTHSGSNVLWLRDPMHGNTETLTCGTKTRRFEQIMREIEAASSAHRKQGTRLGGARNLQPEDLSRRYLSKVDPRLTMNKPSI